MEPLVAEAIVLVIATLAMPLSAGVASVALMVAVSRGGSGGGGGCRMRVQPRLCR